MTRWAAVSVRDFTTRGATWVVTAWFVVSVAALGLTGCGGDRTGGRSGPGAADTARAGPRAGAKCAELASSGRAVRFTSGGAGVAGLVFGTGRTGVVLAHQNRGDVCEWLPFGRQLAGQGYRVLAFDFPGEGASDVRRPDVRLDADVKAAAEYLRADGATAVVLMGASKGGTAVLSAATQLTPPPVAVVSLSAPTMFDSVDALAAARKLTVPVLYLAGELDPPFQDAATELHAATPATTPRTLLIVLGSEHGTALFGSAEAPKVQAAIGTLLRTHAPA